MNNKITLFLKKILIYKLWVIPLIFASIGVVAYWYFPNLSDTVLDEPGIARILTIFVIANSLFSLIVAIVIKRESLRNKRKNLIVSLFCLWASVFVILIEIIRGEPYYLASFPDFPNPFTRIAIIPWIFGVVYLLQTTYATLTIDNIQFEKEKLDFKQKNPEQWGFESINNQLSQRDKDIYFPIIVLADEATRPWKILLRFIVSSLSYDNSNDRRSENTKNCPGAIYFTFTRPASEIKNMLESELSKMIEEDSNIEENKILGGEVNIDNVIFIDCYSLDAEKGLWNNNLKKENLYYANSFDPHEINKKYEKALKKLRDRGCNNIRVAYDSISDFLTFTDFQIATQYLRHNMGFEQRREIQSLYLFRSGTMQKEKEEYFLWFANGVLQMKSKTTEDPKKQVIDVEFRGPFRTPKKFMLDYSYNTYTDPMSNI